MESALDKRLHLPAPNVFIPTDFSLKNVEEKATFPLLLRKESYLRLWYKPDMMFSTPKADVKIDFNCPYVGSSPEATVLTSIFIGLLMNDLYEDAYYAGVAGLNFAINGTGNGFEVIVHGYNHKLRTVLETVVQKIAKFRVRDEKFPVIKEIITKQMRNVEGLQPYEQALQYSSLILVDRLWPREDLQEVLSHLEADNVTKFVHQMLSRTFLECYISGNIDRYEAESIIEYIEVIFFKDSPPKSKAVFSSELLTNRVTNLQRGISYFYPVKSLNPDDEISSLVHYIQVHQEDFVLNAKLQLFTSMVHAPFLHQLRSVEQLGYIVNSMPRTDFAIHGVQFVIQSLVKGPRDINSRVAEFLKSLESLFYKMTEVEFKMRVNSLIHAKIQKPKNLVAESLIYWQEIMDGTLAFDRREREVAALKQLNKKDFVDFFDEYIKVGAPGKKTLSVQVYGKAHDGEYKKDKNKQTEPNVVLIDDIFDFKRSLPLYSSFKGRMQL